MPELEEMYIFTQLDVDTRIATIQKGYSKDQHLIATGVAASVAQLSSEHLLSRVAKILKTLDLTPYG
jgi:hypothetical protein